MLVNIKGTVKNDEINFTIPSLTFDRTFYVSLHHIILSFKSNQTDVGGYVSTTLIDRSPLNPDQILANFQQIGQSKTLFYQPPHLQYYKIQRIDLSSSEFILKLRENIKIREIIDIDILLHIFDARIQSRLEQSIH